jgi:hypothetical protein
LVDYLTHYYVKGTPPFHSLSTLPDDEALKLMTALYAETVFGAMFKAPCAAPHNCGRGWIFGTILQKYKSSPGG